MGRWTKTDYDALNRPIKVTLNYEDGDPLTVTPPHSGADTDLVQVTRYDALGRVAQQIDNYVDGVFTITKPITDRITFSEYDTLGRVVTSILNVGLPMLSSRLLQCGAALAMVEHIAQHAIQLTG